MSVSRCPSSNPDHYRARGDFWPPEDLPHLTLRRMKGSKKFEPRCAEAVAALLLENEPEVTIDLPSDDEEDAEELLSDSEPEQEADDTKFFDPNNVEWQKNSDIDESQEEEGPSAPKRKKIQNKTTKTQRVEYQCHIAVRENSQNRSNSPQLKVSPGPIGEAKKVFTSLEAWNLIFDEALLEKILSPTNEQIKRYRESFETDDAFQQSCKDLDMPELRAFVGLLYLSGLQKAGRTNPEDLWSSEYGSEIYRATIPLNRFKIIFRMLRFDEKSTRIQRKQRDGLAAIREVWEKFVSNCEKYYNPNSYCTVNEKILSFRGRCPFRVRKNGKIDECGVKIVTLNDATTFYMYSAVPYAGKVTAEGEETAEFRCIREISKNLHGTGRTIICGNRFSTVEIFEKMLHDHHVAIVGTVSKKEREISTTSKRSVNVGSTKFPFFETATVVDRATKKNKIVVARSNSGRTSDVDAETRESEIVEFYVSTKTATEMFEKISDEYSTERKTLRWSTRLWMSMLDQGAINSTIIYNFNGANVKLRRKDFLKSLVMGLIEPHLRARLDSTFLRRDLRFFIENVLRTEPELKPAPAVSFRRSRCVFCPRAMDKKVRVNCDQCNRPACDEHRSTFCKICSSRD